jgi:hypothetical protein
MQLADVADLQRRSCIAFESSLAMDPCVRDLGLGEI